MTSLEARQRRWRNGRSFAGVMVAGRNVPLSIVGLLTFVSGWFTFGLVEKFMMGPSSISPMSLFSLALIATALSSPALPQEIVREPASGSVSECKAIFNDVQIGISTSNVELLARNFAPHVGLSLRGDENGTFSAKQAYYVLLNYFRSRKFGRLQFSTIRESKSTPYATGSVEFTHKGTRARAQVYVALTTEGRKPVITQLSIY